MKFNYIKTVGFRKFKEEFETNLYDITDISGGNTKGKTNILYAIVWAFLGTNLTGDDKVWLGNKNSDNCYVELNFIDNNNEEHTLIRYKNKYDNKLNFISLDKMNINQEKLQKFYSDKKLFLSIINTNYFINKKPAEQKELLDKYLPKIDISMVYNKLDDSEKGYLEGIPSNIIEYLKELNSNKRMYEDNIKSLKGKIEYAESVINDGVEEKKFFEKDEELLLAKQELSFLNNDNKLSEKENQKKIVNNLENRIIEIQKQLSLLSIDLQEGKRDYLSVKNSNTACCPMCKQKIQNESKLSTIKNLKEELESKYAKKVELEKELLDSKSKIIIEKCKLHIFDKVTSENLDKQIVLVKNQIQELEQEKLDIETYNNSILIKQNNINKANRDISYFKNQIKEYENFIENVKITKEIVQKLYVNYIEEKMKFATNHLKNVKVKYYTILKDSGELKEDFIITYNNNELKNLSKSEMIAISLEFSNMFNKISGVNIPIFIDDYESCADYNFIADYSKNTQIILSRVKKGNLLRISDYCKDGYTKTKISGFKTLEIYKNIEHVQRVA